MELNDDGIARADLYARWFKRADGSVGEVLTSRPLETVPPALAEWDEISTEAEYLADLEVLEDAIEDAKRTKRAADAKQRGEDHAALVKLKIPAEVAARMLGLDVAENAKTAAGEDEWSDPNRRTVRRTPPAPVGV